MIFSPLVDEETEARGVTLVVCGLNSNPCLSDSKTVLPTTGMGCIHELFLKGPDSKYLDFMGQTVCVATLQPSALGT